jgi:hypothetical protein
MFFSSCVEIDGIPKEKGWVCAFGWYLLQNVQGRCDHVRSDQKTEGLGFDKGSQWSSGWDRILLAHTI